MSLFGFGKKKEEETKAPACACSRGDAQETESSECCCGTEANDNTCCCGTDEGVSGIKVLGSGCKSCHELFENAKKAVSNMGISAEVEYITDMEKVMSYGVMSMPALVVNEKVVTMGKVLKPADVEELLNKSLQ